MMFVFLWVTDFGSIIHGENSVDKWHKINKLCWVDRCPNGARIVDSCTHIGQLSRFFKDEISVKENSFASQDIQYRHVLFLLFFFEFRKYLYSTEMFVSYSYRYISSPYWYLGAMPGAHVARIKLFENHNIVNKHKNDSFHKLSLVLKQRSKNICSLIHDIIHSE